MTNLNRDEIQFIHDAATSVMWSMEDLVYSGHSFRSAKKTAFDRSRPMWKHIEPHVRDAIECVVDDIAISDLSAGARKKLSLREREVIESLRGYKMGWLEGLVHRVTGYSF